MEQLDYQPALSSICAKSCGPVARAGVTMSPSLAPAGERRSSPIRARDAPVSTMSR